jgi:hypothetical protein
MFPTLTDMCPCSRQSCTLSCALEQAFLLGTPYRHSAFGKPSLRWMTQTYIHTYSRRHGLQAGTETACADIVCQTCYHSASAEIRALKHLSIHRRGSLCDCQRACIGRLLRATPWRPSRGGGDRYSDIVPCLVLSVYGFGAKNIAERYQSSCQFRSELSHQCNDYEAT